ncbi:MULTISPECIES: PepSY-associated TM helix domain-containing protein [unclassified Phyllobacterium]|uniref:PepSY-associated TM helix domain-containing protein n=1 Tax=unclassified Phyllobacterium TaxID=2638441 RepID=UPI003065C60C
MTARIRGRSASKRKNRSQFWLALHGWLGLPIWFFLFFICLTGSIATISEEIAWLFNPAMRANAPSSNAVKLGYDEITERVRKQNPDDLVTMISIPKESRYALQVFVTLPNGGEATLYVNTYTGVVQGQKSALDFKEFVHSLHGWLLIPFTATSSLGWYLVSAMSVPLMGSLITGLIVYKKFWRSILRPRLRIKSGARIFWGDFHRLAGLWAIPFILVISTTACWFLVKATLEDNGYRLPGYVEAPKLNRDQVSAESLRSSFRTISADGAIKVARSKIVSFEPTFLILPASVYDTIAVWGYSSNPLLFETVYINPFSADVVEVRSRATYGAAEVAIKSMRPLHTGDFAGLWLRLIYFFFGMLLTTMSLSGFLIWAKRTAQATAKTLRKAHYPVSAERSDDFNRTHRSQ